VPAPRAPLHHSTAGSGLRKPSPAAAASAAAAAVAGAGLAGAGEVLSPRTGLPKQTITPKVR
jgi:hypothetical protein